MNKLKYLLLTDIHFNLNYLNLVKSKGIENIDGILLLGDLVNANHEEPKSCIEKDENEIQQVLNLAKQIHQNVLYIPGNHDPGKYFKNTNFNDDYPINLHKKVHRLKDNLVLAGLGGSVHSYLTNHSDHLFWKGYPYESEADYEKDLKDLLKPILNKDCTNVENNEIQPGDSILLLTHTGPSNLATTDVNPQPFDCDMTQVQCGSESLYNLLQSEPIQTIAFPSNPLRPTKKYHQLTPSPDKIQYHLVANLHGHSHAGWGMVGQLGGHLPVINPGSLQDGRYAMIELTELNPIPNQLDDHPKLLNRIWTITSTQFYTIW